MQHRRLLASTVLFVAFLGCARPPSDPVTRSRQIASHVWSPYCPGQLLTDCATKPAQQLRDQISRRVADGQSEKQILRWVESNYGASALADGSTTSKALLFAPLFVFAAGGVILGRNVKRWTKPEQEN